MFHDGINIILDIYDPLKTDFPFEDEQIYTNGEGFLIIYDVTKKYMLKTITKEIENIHKFKKVNDFPIVVVGNKIDLEDQREITFDEGKELVSKYPRVLFFESSAKENINVDDVFHALVGEIYEDKKSLLQPEEKKECLMM